MEPNFFWIFLAICLLIAEALTLGIFILFFGLGALVTGLILYIVPLSFNSQIILFLTISVVTLLCMRNTMRSWLYGKKKAVTTDNVEDVLGRRAVVIDAIVPPKYGLVDMKGTNWKAESEKEISKDKTVEVIGRENLVLKVRELDTKDN
ncbi:MAG: NfeD family protein, partial [Pseudomonadota bacterium]|nr:NfeD family protein [Pseudomonadota bacterium]